MIKSRFLVFSLLASFFLTPLIASRNVSRYFPFLERPEEYITKKRSYFYPAFFITTASTAFHQGGGNTGIPELLAGYDLQRVITSINAVKQAAGITNYNPFANEIGYTDWNTKGLLFHVDGKIKSRGVIVSAEQYLSGNLSCGFFLPVMHANTSIKFTFDPENSHADARSATAAEILMVDRVRRNVHSQLGLKGSDWDTAGPGDLDLHLRWRREWDHVLKMRSIDLNVQAGVLVPTGVKRAENYPSSVPFGSNGHWGFYADVISEFELKQNWKFGILGGIMHQCSKTHKNIRIPYLNESPSFSALSGPVKIDPGLTLKFSPYFTLENIMDGMHFQFRYTFLKHNSDKWIDKRSEGGAASCPCVPSYLCSTDELADGVRCSRQRRSRWKSHYLTFQLAYDSVEAMREWLGKPKIYALFDYAYGGRGMCKTHQFTLGVELDLW